MNTPNPTQRRSQINGSRPSPLKIHKPAAKSAGNAPHRHHPKRQPIIIYTHSPKIIHTQPRDFMALVQSLTGATRSPAAAGDPPASGIDDNDSSSVLTDGDENSGGHVIDSLFGDIPLFTPNSAAGFFRFPGGSYSSPGSTSPSVLEFMKGVHRY